MNFFKKNLKPIAMMVFLSVIIVLPHVTFAQSVPASSGSGLVVSSNNTSATCTPNTLCNPLNVGSIQDLLYLIVNIATYIGVILAVLALIWVGFKFIAAQGNPDKLKEARGFFYAVIIGIAILIGANAIVTILKNTLTSAGVVQPGALGSQ